MPHPLDQLPDDIRDHLDRETADHIARGLPPDAARREALRRFGSTALAAEQARAVWIPIWIDQLRQDLRYGLRVFRRSPGASLAAVLILALGIGVTSAVFSIVRGVMLKPLPYRDPARIVAVWETNRGGTALNVIASANLLEWRARSRSFDGIGMVGPSRLTMTLDGRAEEVSGFAATGSVFSVLGVGAQMGRVYTPAEDAETDGAVILLDHEFWQSRLGGRTDILGTTLVASGRPRTVVGVLPAGFTIEGARGNYYIPYGATDEELRASPGRGASHGLARLRDAVSLEQARGEMEGLAAQLAEENPRLNSGRTVRLVPIQEQTVGKVRPALLVLSGAVLMVLLLACANVASLLLARATARTRELGLRTALGAGRLRLVRQMLTESVLFACIAGGAGLALAVAFERGLVALVAGRVDVPRLDQVSLDAPVVLFTLAVSVATGLVFGVVPAVVATGWRGESLRDTAGARTTPESRRVLSSFTVAELALSVVLLAGAGLLGLSFLRLQNVNPGFRADQLLTARITLAGERWRDPRRSAGFFEEVVAGLRALPGVRGAAGISFLPLTPLRIGTSFWPLDRPAPGPGEAASTDVLPVTPAFFQTMGIPMIAGRDFDARDTLDAPVVAIVSRSLARATWGDQDPLGRRLHVNIGLPNDGDAEVVGMVGDVAMSALDADVRPAVYVPHTQLAIGLMAFVVRTETDPEALAPSLANVVRALDPEVPVAEVRTMRDVVDTTLGQSRAIAVLLAAFAIAALLLAGAGVYGVMAYSVSRRTQEIGVRVALGARPGEIVGMVVRQALRLAVAGVGVGLAAALALARLLGTLLYDTAPADPAVFAGVVTVLVATALLAAWIPARRAARVDPLVALRCE
jgi:putative ABC transport system permease protein